jgi:hypothetical protein
MTGTYFRLSCRHPPCEIDLNGNSFVTRWNNGTGSDFYAIFEDLTITGGDVVNRNATHKVSGTKKRGGAISAIGNENITSCVELINTTIRDNCAPTGGAMYLRDCNFVMRDSNCLNNTAKDGRGGCARIAGYGNSTIDGSLFEFNCAEESGGALYYYNKRLDETEDPATHIISSSDFVGNKVQDDLGHGGGVAAVTGVLIVAGANFFNNSASVGGALSISEFPFFGFRRKLNGIVTPRRALSSSPILRAEIFGAKFSGNEADGPGPGSDINAEFGEVYEIEVTCDDATEFCDACNSTDITSTNIPLSTCKSSKKNNKTCVGGSCDDSQECSASWIATPLNCGSAFGVSGDICCIPEGSKCLDISPEKCCGNYTCDDGECVAVEILL